MLIVETEPENKVPGRPQQDNEMQDRPYVEDG
jgi:hypothetical protein